MPRQPVGGQPIRYLAATVAGLTIASLTTGARAAPTQPPPSFVRDALCVHAGRTFTTHWYPGARPQYALFGHVYYYRTVYDDLPHGRAGNDGEAAWSEVNSYGGGLQFTLGTWNRAAVLSAGRVPYVRSNSAIALQPASVQIVAAWLIVSQDGGSFREWPNTARACSLPVF